MPTFTNCFFAVFIKQSLKVDSRWTSAPHWAQLCTFWQLTPLYQNKFEVTAWISLRRSKENTKLWLLRTFFNCSSKEILGYSYRQTIQNFFIVFWIFQINWASACEKTFEGSSTSIRTFRVFRASWWLLCHFHFELWSSSSVVVFHSESMQTLTQSQPTKFSK